MDIEKKLESLNLSESPQIMDIIEKKLEALNLSESGAGVTEDAKPSSDLKLSLLDYFDGKKGSGGRAIFEEHIVPFLSLEELLVSAATCRQMNAMCRTYTVGEVLWKHKIEIPNDHKMELGKLVLGSVSAKYSPARVHRRFVTTATERFWARLYHPAQLEEIELVMCTYFNNVHHGIIERDIIMSRMFDDDFDWEANKGVTTPVLVSATFGDEVGGMIDVTLILRYLLMKQGNTKLILRPPPPPHGPRFNWYICLFSDPCERVTKKLRITARTEDGQERQHIFVEDQIFEMSLKAGRLAKVEEVVEVKRLYVYPNPMKLLGGCCIVELQEQILQQKKKQQQQSTMNNTNSSSSSSSSDMVLLDPNKPLRACTLQELYEQIKIQKERQNAAKVWPNPMKAVGSCYIQELEEQLIQVKKQQAANKKNQPCYLPLLADNLFGNNILDFLVPVEIAQVLQVPEIVNLYRLSGYVCRVHANKFIHPTQWKTTLAAVRTRHTDNGKPAIVDGQYYDQYKQYVEWKLEWGIAPYPHSCVVCERSRRAKEQCRDGCLRIMSWDDLFTCNVCDRRLCCRCSDKFEYSGDPKSGICDDCVDGERALGKQIRSRWTRI